MIITVLGASGHTGRALVPRLLAAGCRVRAVGRSAERLADARRLGADLALGDLADHSFLTDTFAGSDAAYVLLPTDRQAEDYDARQAREGASIAAALAAARVPRVVALSSLGTHVPEGTGLILGLRAQEARLRGIAGTDLLLLRPASFFENFLDTLDVVRAHGVVVDHAHPDLPLPMVAADDIAAVAADALLHGGWQGVAVRELLGPRDLSWTEATRLLGQALGQPALAYVPLPADELIAAMTSGGLSLPFARRYVEMVDAFNRGVVQPEGGRRSPAMTTPTRFEDVVDRFAAAYRGA